MHGELYCPVFQGAQVHSNMCYMGGASLGGKGTVMGGTRNGESLAAIFFIPLAPKYFCALQRWGVRC